MSAATSPMTTVQQASARALRATQEATALMLEAINDGSPINTPEIRAACEYANRQWELWRWAASEEAR